MLEGENKIYLIATKTRIQIFQNDKK